MEPIRILRDEHDEILRGLEALEACTHKLYDRQPVPPKNLEAFIEFFKLFADKKHHGKEEDLLFPAMIDHGFSREVGPIHCMLADHENNRALTRQMVEAAAQYRAGDKEAGLRFAGTATQYIQVLREHIQKENLVLFSMAENCIPTDEEPELLAKFNNVDRNQIGDPEIKRLLDLRDSLVQQFCAAVAQ